MTFERDRNIAIDVLSGGSYRSVGKAYGLSGTNVRVVTLKMAKLADPESRRYRPMSEVRQDAERLIRRIRGLPSPPSATIPRRVCGERTRQLTIDVLAGGSLREIAEKYGIPRERARQAVARMIREVDPDDSLRKEAYQKLIARIKAL